MTERPAFWNDIRHFRPEEPYLYSRDAPETGLLMQEGFMRRLDAWRDELGLPCRINSGYRTLKRNRAVGGGKKSAHMIGRAVDIDWSGWSLSQRKRAIELARKHGFTGFGIGRTYLHLDDVSALEGYGRPLTWWYADGGIVYQRPNEAWAIAA